MRVASPTVWIYTFPWLGRPVSKPDLYGTGPDSLEPGCDTEIAHHPPLLPTCIGTLVSLPSSGVTFGTVQDFAAPVWSTAYCRAGGRKGGFGAQLCTSAAAAISSSQEEGGGVRRNLVKAVSSSR